MRDSYRIISIGLRYFNATFDLPENIHKLDFCYLYNKEDSYKKVLDGPPSKELFGYTAMPKSQRIEFDKKYEAEKERMRLAGEKYRLPVKISEYCRQDVQVCFLF